MILTILFAVLAIVGLAIVIIEHNVYKAPEWVGIAGCVLLFAGMIVVIIGGGLGIGHSIDYDLAREDAIEQREVIVYRLEQQANSDARSGEITINGGAYEDVRKFNQRVRYQNKWGTNPWFNWFVGWDYVGLEEIDILGGER